MKLSIYQSYYLESQKKLLDKAFIPFDNTANPAPLLREQPIHSQLYEKHQDETDHHWGLVSWKWHEKTKAEGKFFVEWIESNPGYDLYFIDPNIFDIAVYKNTFINGEISHPGLLKFSQALIDKLGMKIDLLKDGFHPSIFSTCTFWIGNSKFWNRWFQFWMKCNRIIIEDSSMNEFMYGFSKKPHLGQKVIHYPFIHERLISLYLAQETDLKWIQYPLDSKYYHWKLENDFEKRGANNGSYVFYRMMYLIHKKMMHCGDNLIVKMSDKDFGHDSLFRFPEFKQSNKKINKTPKVLEEV